MDKPTLTDFSGQEDYYQLAVELELRRRKREGSK